MVPRARTSVLLPVFATVFAAGGESGAQCLDYSSHLHWDALAQYASSGGWPELFGHYLVATSMVGLERQTAVDVLDLSDPARPRHALQTDLPFDSTRTVDLDRLYLMPADSGGLHVVDVSDPLDPAMVGTVATDARGWARQGRWLYVSYYRYFQSEFGLQVFDLGEPKHPVLVRDIPHPRALDHVVASGTRLVVRELFQDHGTGWIQVFDITHPDAPVLSAEIVQGSRDIDCLDSILYVAHGQDGIVVYDLEASPPSAVGLLPVPAGVVAVRGDKLLYEFWQPHRSENVVGIASLEDPRAPRVTHDLLGPQPPWYSRGGFIVGDRLIEPFLHGVSTIDWTDGPQPVARAVGALSPGRVNGDVAANERWAFTATPFLGIIDLADPAAPRAVGSFPIGAVGKAVCARQGLVYFALGPDGLMIAPADVKNPADPERLSWVQVGADVRNVDAEGGIVGMTSAGAELVVVDASDPVHPGVRSIFQLPFVAGRLALSERMAFVLGPQAVQIVDLTDPAGPVLRGAIEMPGAPHGLRAQGDRCWIVGDWGLTLVDVSDPDHPEPGTTWPLESPARDVEIMGKWAFVTTDTPQISIIDLDRNEPGTVQGACYGGYADSSPTRIVRGGPGFVFANTWSVATIAAPCEPTVLLLSDLRADAVDRAVRVSWIAPGPGRSWVVTRTDGPSADPRVIPTPVNTAGGRWWCVDDAVQPETEYWYSIADAGAPKERSDPVMVRTGVWGAPLSLQIAGANPFRGQARVSFTVPAAGRARLTIHDVTGRLVRVLLDDEVPNGPRAVAWDGRDRRGLRAAAGTYYLTLENRGQKVRTRIVRID